MSLPWHALHFFTKILHFSLLHHSSLPTYWGWWSSCHMPCITMHSLWLQPGSTQQRPGFYAARKCSLLLEYEIQYHRLTAALLWADLFRAYVLSKHPKATFCVLNEDLIEELLTFLKQESEALSRDMRMGLHPRFWGHILEKPALDHHQQGSWRFGGLLFPRWGATVRSHCSSIRTPSIDVRGPASLTSPLVWGERN